MRELVVAIFPPTYTTSTASNLGHETRTAKLQIVTAVASSFKNLWPENQPVRSPRYRHKSTTNSLTLPSSSHSLHRHFTTHLIPFGATPLPNRPWPPRGRPTPKAPRHLFGMMFVNMLTEAYETTRKKMLPAGAPPRARSVLTSLPNPFPCKHGLPILSVLWENVKIDIGALTTGF